MYGSWKSGQGSGSVDESPPLARGGATSGDFTITAVHGTRSLADQLLCCQVLIQVNPERALQSHAWSETTYVLCPWPHVLKGVWAELPLTTAMRDVSLQPRMPECCINERL